MALNLTEMTQAAGALAQALSGEPAMPAYEEVVDGTRIQVAQMGGMSAEMLRDTRSVFGGTPPDRTKFLGGKRPDPSRGEKPLCSSAESGSFVRDMYMGKVLEEIAAPLWASGSKTDRHKAYEYDAVFPLVFLRMSIEGVDVFFDGKFNKETIKSGNVVINVDYLGQDTIRVSSGDEQGVEFSQTYTRAQLIRICDAMDKVSAAAKKHSGF